MSLTQHLIKVFHFVGAVQFLFAIYYECFCVLPKEVKLRDFTFGGKFIYLTFLNVIFHACFYSVALVNDFTGSNEPAEKNPSLLRKVRDFIFATFAFPLAVHIALTFWTIYAIDSQLIFPDIIRPIYPWWFNNIVHTNIAIFIVIEMIILHHQYLGWKKEGTVLLAFVVGYVVWVNVIKLVTGCWVYPILTELGMVERIGFFIATGISPIIFYFIGDYVNERFWQRRLSRNSQLT